MRAKRTIYEFVPGLASFAACAVSSFSDGALLVRCATRGRRGRALIMSRETCLKVCCCALCEDICELCGFLGVDAFRFIDVTSLR